MPIEWIQALISYQDDHTSRCARAPNPDPGLGDFNVMGYCVYTPQSTPSNSGLAICIGQWFQVIMPKVRCSKCEEEPVMWCVMQTQPS